MASCGAEDADAAGAGAAADFLAFLVAQLVEVAHPRQRGAEIADVVARPRRCGLRAGLGGTRAGSSRSAR